MALRFKFKARPEIRRPRFGGSGSPSKRTRGGSMARLKKEKEESKETQSLSRGDKTAASIVGAVEDVKKQMAENKKVQPWHHSNTAGTPEKEAAQKAAENKKQVWHHSNTAGTSEVAAKKKAAKKRAQEKVARTYGTIARTFFGGKKTSK